MKKSLRFIIVLMTLTTSSCDKTNTKFVLSGEIENFENELIYIDYENIVDSVRVRNGSFKFEGTLSKPTPIIFTSNGLSSSSREVYLENRNVRVKLTFKKQKLPNGKLIDFFVVNKTEGSITDSIYKEFMEFEMENSGKPNWKDLLNKKLRAIFNEFPGNILSGGLLYDVSINNQLDQDQLRKLHSIINWEKQDVIRNARVREILFPNENLVVGSSIIDFELKNSAGNSISTIDFRGTFLLLEFWASWCIPCLEEFPELKTIYERYNKHDFEILSVSIDESHERWLNALKKNELPWPNVITQGGQKSEVPISYKVFGVPTNFLIDKNGDIIAKDLTPSELETWLVGEFVE